ncbi:carboxyvinyl-carboxyphosphonate phosphorylmutase, partial [Streptomyces sp. NPDC102278]
VDVAIYSTPCLFAAHRAMDTALAELRLSDGRLPAAEDGQEIGVSESTRLLARNIARHHTLPAAREGAGV